MSLYLLNDASRISVLNSDKNKNLCRLIIEPLERGYGTTIGNSLRRVLLSSITGSAISAVRIKGVDHEYDNIPGVREDVLDILLNIKNIVVNLVNTEEKRISFSVKGPCIVDSDMIPNDSELQIISKSHICKITDEIELSFDFYCSLGKGYSSSKDLKEVELPIGFINLDPVYSPVVNVSYNVESARVLESVNYDKLILSVETNGSVLPLDTIVEASNILSAQFDVVAKINEIDGINVIGKKKSIIGLSTGGNSSDDSNNKKNKQEFNPTFFKRINDLNLESRIKNCLASRNIVFVGDLVTKDIDFLQNIDHFGDKSLQRVLDWLKSEGLSVGMKVEGWPPDDLC